jgi:hypothetical protein
LAGVGKVVFAEKDLTNPFDQTFFGIMVSLQAEIVDCVKTVGTEEPTLNKF